MVNDKSRDSSGESFRILELIECGKVMEACRNYHVALGEVGAKPWLADIACRLPLPSTIEVNELQHLLLAKQYDKLEAASICLRDRYPYSPTPLQYLGFCYFTNENYPAAVTEFEQVLILNPRDGASLSLLGAALHKMTRLEEALECHKKAESLRPDSSEIKNNLAAVLADLGRHKEALVYYRAAIRINPEYELALYNMANSLRLMGDLSEAEVFYRNVLRQNPANREALNNLGVCLRDMGEIDQALDVYANSLNAGLESADILNNYAGILKQLGRLDEAEYAYKSALKQEPNRAEIINNLAAVYVALGEHRLAKAQNSKALSLNPDLPEALVAAGDLSVDEGDFEGARIYYNKALKVRPNMPEAMAALCRTKKMTGEDKDWLISMMDMAKSGLTLRQHVSVEYAFGKYYDDLKEFDLAFKHYEKANKIKRQLVGVPSMLLVKEWVDKISALYTKASIAKANPGASPSDVPLFIVGMPRSGTTLIEQIISSHPQIYGAGELQFWRRHSANSIAENEKIINDPLRVSKVAAEALDYLSVVSNGSRYVIDKTPGNFFSLGMINKVFPNAKIIHVVRNPIDTCLSCFFQNFNSGHDYSNNLNDLFLYYLEYNRLMQHWRSVIPSERLMTVSYEAVLDDRVKFTREIIDFIDVGWHDACLDFCSNRRVISTASNWQARQPIYKTSADRWLNYAQHIAVLRPLLDIAPSAQNK